MSSKSSRQKAGSANYLVNMGRDSDMYCALSVAVKLRVVLVMMTAVLVTSITDFQEQCFLNKIDFV